jgi:hypothetical protein
MKENSDKIEKIEKIKSLNEISRVCELNKIISEFSVLNEFITQSILYIALKKGENKSLLEEELDIFKNKLQDISVLANKLINF